MAFKKNINIVSTNNCVKANFTAITLILIFFITLAFKLFYIKKMSLPIVLDDEFGYLANAAFFAGYDWSGVVSKIYYYSNGYSLLLVPFFLILNNPLTIYKAVLLFNSITGGLIIFIAYKVADTLFPDVKNHIKIICSFVISLYPSYFAFSFVSWPENLLSFLFWLVFYLFLKLRKEQNTRLYLIISLLLSYLYFVHSRMIGVLVAGSVLILFYCIKRSDWPNLAYFISSTIIMVILSSYLKGYAKEYLWLNSEFSNVNDFKGVLADIFNLIDSKGLVHVIINFFHTFLGQLFYLVSASFLFVCFGFFFILKLVGGRKSHNSIIRLSEGNMLGIIFLASSFILSLAINVMFISKGERADHIIYGRYNECITGVILFIGLLAVCGQRIHKKVINATQVIYLAVAVYLFLNIQNILDTKPYFYLNISSLYFLKNPSNKIDILTVACITVFVFGLFNLAIDGKNLRIISLILISCLFIYSGYFITQDHILALAQSYERYVTVMDAIDGYPAENTEIYYIDRGNYAKNMSKAYFQLLLPKYKVQFTSIDELAGTTIKENSFIISNNITTSMYIPNIQLVDIYNKNDYLWITTGKSEDTQSKDISLPLHTFYSQNKILSEEGGRKDFLESNGNNDFMVYGPYLNIEKGNYNIQIDLELIKSPSEKIGYIDIYSSGKVYYKMEMEKGFFRNNRYKFQKSLKFTEDINNLEIRVYVEKDVILRLHDVSLSINDLCNEQIWIPEEGFSTQTGIVTSKGSFISYGKEGFLLFGPYTGLEAG